jgi:hypothetical protein
LARLAGQGHVPELRPAGHPVAEVSIYRELLSAFLARIECAISGHEWYELGGRNYGSDRPICQCCLAVKK